MLEFQSDLEYLINPPPGYLLAGVDLLGELSDLRDQVTSSNITGEIDFENSIEIILGKAHDGHLTYQLDGLSVSKLCEVPAVWYPYRSTVYNHPRSISTVCDYDSVIHY